VCVVGDCVTEVGGNVGAATGVSVPVIGGDVGGIVDGVSVIWVGCGSVTIVVGD